MLLLILVGVITGALMVTAVVCALAGAALQPGGPLFVVLGAATIVLMAGMAGREAVHLGYLPLWQFWQFGTAFVAGAGGTVVLLGLVAALFSGRIDAGKREREISS